MHTRFLPVLALALASTVGCSQKPPTLTTAPLQPDAQRQIAAVNDGTALATQAAVEQNLGTPLSVQELPQRLTADQLVELPADRLQQMATQADDQTQVGDRSTQQWRGRGWRGYGFRGRGLRYYGYRGYYYPYYSYGAYYYPYAYYPYTYAYYPYSYYNYAYYPYYTPYYLYSSYYYPYAFSRFGYGRFGYGRFGYGRRWR